MMENGSSLLPANPLKVENSTYMICHFVTSTLVAKFFIFFNFICTAS